MNITVDDIIFRLQTNGGISRLWRSLLPHLQMALPEAEWNTGAPDVFLSTYYEPKPPGSQSVVVVYDMIAEQYTPIGGYHDDALKKRAAIAEADAIIAISDSTARDVHRFTGRTAVTAYCGVDTCFRRVTPEQIADFRSAYKLDKPYVLTVGKRGLYKNVKALYQAWGLWEHASAFTLLTVGGEHDLPEDVWFDARYPGVRRQISLNDTALAAAYSGAHALVYPSYIEGFGLPILEAVMCGCPVIASRAKGILEIINSVKYISTIEPHRPRTIAAALEQVNHPTYRLDMTLNAYAPARAFTWARMASVIANTVRSLA